MIRVTTLNVGGQIGLWRVMHGVVTRQQSEVFCLQETSVDARHWKPFEASAKKAGYRAYMVPAFPCTREHDVQLLTVWVSQIAVVNVYAKPEEESRNRLACLLPQALFGQRVQEKWLAAGDFNVEADDEDMVAACHLLGGQFHPQGRPTRWNADREIDLFASNCPDAVSCVRLLDDEWVSDHIPVTCKVDCNSPRHPLGRLQAAQVWRKPHHLNAAQWTMLLRKHWQTLQLPQFDPSSIQEAWDEFMQQLDATFRAATAEAAKELEGSDEAEELQRQLRKRGPKGGLPERSLCNRPSKPARPGESNMRICKLRRKLARAFEAKRLLRVADPVLHENPLHGLLHKVLGFVPDSVGDAVRLLLVEVQDLQKSISAAELSDKNARLKQWKADMHHLPQASRWIKGRRQPCMPTIISDEGATETPEQAVAAIASHWSGVFAEGRRPAQEVAANLCASAPAREQAQWQWPQPKQLRRALAETAPTGGAGNWQPCELRYLPDEPLERWLFLARQWALQGSVPKQLSFSVQSNLVKPKKVQQGQLHAKHTRPITVMSVFWRALASAMIKQDCVRDWCCQAFHPAVRGIRGRTGTELTAAEACEALRRKGFLATMDLSQAYDRMSPHASTQLLVHMGWPPDWARLLGTVWGSQIRWMKWANHVGAQQLPAGTAVPQGCPAAPLALQAWMSAGAYEVERQAAQAQPQEAADQRIYMDDRTLVSNTATGLLCQVDLWRRWCDSVNLCENDGKVQLTASGARRKAVLFELLQNTEPDLCARLQDQVEILGCHTANGPRENTVAECDRLKDSHEVAAAVGLLPIPADDKLQYCRALAVSKAAYGWIARLPTLQDTHGLAATVRRTMDTAKGASKWSRAAVYGGTTHLDCISGTKLACNAQRWMLDPAAAPPWNGGYGTVAYTLRKWLRNRGWTEAGPWSWTHPSGPLRLGRGNSVKRVAHAVRCGWREWAFQKLIGTNRNDVKELGTYPSGRGAQIGAELPPLSVRCRNQLALEFRQTDLKRMRHWMGQDPARATVVLGSQVSPAMHDRMHGQQVQAAQCPWCQAAAASWDHMCWTCASRPAEAPSVPRRRLQRRFGWPEVGAGEYGDKVIAWMAQVQTHVWTLRFNARPSYMRQRV